MNSPWSGPAAIPWPTPFLRLFDGQGAFVTGNDDDPLDTTTNNGLNSRIQAFQPTQTGTYYLEAGAYADAHVGDWRLTATETAAPAPKSVWSADQVASYLTEGYWGGSARAWAPAGGTTEITYDVSGLTAAGQTLAAAALAAWTEVADLTFTAVQGGAQLVFQDHEAGAWAESATAGGQLRSATINVSTAWLATYGTAIGGYGYQTYLHEIGHALGLGHAGGYNGQATYGIDNLYLNDSWQMSLMSYFSQAENTHIAATEAYTVTPMLADIVAVQGLYGAAETRAGDTVYAPDRTGIEGDLGDGRARTLWDAGGHDLIDRSADIRPLTLDLRPGAASDLNGHVGTLVIAQGSWIEDALGGAATDLLRGNILDNRLEGGAGADTLQGQGGDDRLIGNSAADRLAGGDGADWLQGGAGDDMLFGEDGADRLDGGSGADDLRGGRGADTLTGGDADDLIRGESDADTIAGNAGDDWIQGNAGRDRAEGNEGDDILFGGGNRDRLYGQEGSDRLEGGDDTDWLYGGNNPDTLEGGAGDDTLAGGGGPDVFVFRQGDGDDRVLNFEPDRDLLRFEGAAPQLRGRTQWRSGDPWRGQRPAGGAEPRRTPARGD